PGQARRRRPVAGRVRADRSRIHLPRPIRRARHRARGLRQGFASRGRSAVTLLHMSPTTRVQRQPMQGGEMNSTKTTKRLTRGALALAVAACVASRAPAAAQEGASSPPAKDYNQRALEIYEFRKAAKSGSDRGQEIFYYKCWFCHNEFTKDIPKLP